MLRSRCGEKGLFSAVFSGAELKKRDAVIRGFGGDGELYDLYRIPELSIGGDNGICIHNHYMAVGKKKNSTVSLILSSNTLYKCDYEIRNSSKELIIHADRRDYYMTLHHDGSTGVFSSEAVGTESMKDSLRGMFK